MKKVLSLLACSSLAGFCVNAQNFADEDYVEKWGKLKIDYDGRQLVSSKTGEAVQLKGWSSFSIHYSEACNSEGDVILQKKYGANVVRWAMYIDDICWGRQNRAYLDNKSMMQEKIKSYIEMCADNGMYAVVDWHILENGKCVGSGDPSKYTKDAVEFFDIIAKWVKDRKYQNVIYELCNEPVGVSWAGTIKPYAETVMEVITKHDPDAVCIVGTNNWCQDIDEAASNQVASKFKSNAIYSFHFYACTHMDKLGGFSTACSKAPVIASEWSISAASGNGPRCAPNGETFLGYCNRGNAGQQLVSWFFWNWGTKNESSSVFKSGGCNSNNLSETGDFAVEAMTGQKGFEIPESAEYDVRNKVPATYMKPFCWENFDKGGQNVAYSDMNSTAYDKDKDGFYQGYCNTCDEIDIFSVAEGYPMDNDGNRVMPKNSCFTIDNTKKGWDRITSACNDACKQQQYGSPLDPAIPYRCLNAGVCYSGKAPRPEEGVDLSGYAGFGAPDTDLGGTNWSLGCLSLIESKGEWIQYTIDVEQAGYYKIIHTINAHEPKRGMILWTNQNDNIVRVKTRGMWKDPETAKAPGTINTNSAPEANIAGTKGVIAKWDDNVKDCGDPGNSWACYGLNEPKGIINEGEIDEEEVEVRLLFKRAYKKQKLVVAFQGDLGDLGPFMLELDNDMPVGEENIPAWEYEVKVSEDVANTVVSEFSIAPNPTSGAFVVSLAGEETGTVSVVNIAGQVVYSEAINNATELTIDKSFAPGIYTVLVQTSAGQKAKKLVVK